MLYYFVLKLRAYLSLKKKELKKVKVAPYAKRNSYLPAAKALGKKMHFTELLHILCHTQQLSLRLFRAVLKNSSSFLKSKT